MHRRQRARRVRRSPTARGAGVPNREGGSLGGVSGRGHECPRSRQAWSWDPQPGRPLPASTWGPLSGRTRELPLGLPASCTVPTSGGRPAAPALSQPGSRVRSGWRQESRGGTGARIRRAERAEGLRERRAAGARSAGPPARRPSRALSGLRRRGTAARLPPATAPPLTNQIGPQQRPVCPRLSLIGRLGSGGSSSLPGGRASSAQ